MAAYRKALEEVKNHVMTELKTPIVITKETVSGSVNDLPLKQHSHQYKAKTLVDIIENVALDAVPWESIPVCLANDRYTELPPPIGTDICPDTSFVLQISIIKNATGTFGTVIKRFIFAEKTHSLRNIDEVVHGTGNLIDYSPTFRSGTCAFQILLERMSHWMLSYRRLEHKPKQAKSSENPNDLQTGFDYIREFGPMAPGCRQALLCQRSRLPEISYSTSGSGRRRCQCLIVTEGSRHLLEVRDCFANKEMHEVW